MKESLLRDCHPVSADDAFILRKHPRATEAERRQHDCHGASAEDVSAMQSHRSALPLR
jgi:hypothetical protein